LHKRLLVACVMEVEGGRRVVVARVPLPEIFADLGAERGGVMASS
jgi:hypothetical protein